MKSIIFDAGPVISLTMNNILWILEPLKEKFGGSFLITPTVRYEIVEKPLATKKFKFEALQVLEAIEKKTLEIIYDERINKKSAELLELADSIFSAHNHNINIVHKADMECVAAALILGSEAVVVDERTSRMLIENPKNLLNLLKYKLHTNVQMDRKKLDEFLNETRGIKMIRSVELAVIAYELGLLDKYLADIEAPKKTLLEGILWGVKLNGCSVSKNEIRNIISMELKS